VTLILTRPEDQSRDFGRAAQARFGDRLQPLIAPLMRTAFLQPPLPAGPYFAVIFTSMRGVAAVTRLDHHLPKVAFCVGQATALAAEKAGFAAVSTDGAADDLVSHLVARPPSGRLLHLRGAEARGDVAARLTRHGIPTDEITVYRQLAQDLTTAAASALCSKGAVIVPLFSPQSARLFRDGLPAASCADLSLALISQAVAKVAADIPATHRAVALRPDAAAMLDAIGELLDRIAPG